MIKESEFLEQLQTAIKANEVTLPSLPEVALRVRDSVEKDNVTAREIADIVTTDAALAARLLQVANSPLYRGRVPIESIHMAVTRLGTTLVRNLVVSLIMKQIFQATSDALDKRMRRLWEESVQIAAISRVLAQQAPRLEPEQAMLAGLIHNIGALPVLAMAEGVQELVEDERRLDRLLENLAPVIGRQILETWEFPEPLAAVPANCRNLEYNGGEEADYVDLVLVSRLQSLSDSPGYQEVDWSQVASFPKIGLEPEIQVVDIEGAAENIAEVEEILLG